MRTRLIIRAMAALTIVLGLALGSTGALAAGKKAGQGETCGGIVGISAATRGCCARTLPGQCKVADAQGKCEVIPQACTTDLPAGLRDATERPIPTTASASAPARSSITPGAARRKNTDDGRRLTDRKASVGRRSVTRDNCPIARYETAVADR